jgi:hypothetical protein
MKDYLHAKNYLIGLANGKYSKSNPNMQDALDLVWKHIGELKDEVKELETTINNHNCSEYLETDK